MSSNALVQTRIDADIKERAAAVLGKLGLTVSDAVRVLLTRTANEGALPFVITAASQDYDAWFRAKVREALNDPGPDLPHDDVEVRLAERKTASRNAAEG